jgi:membrane-bound lytic murein transglycosylase B
MTARWNGVILRRLLQFFGLMVPLVLAACQAKPVAPAPAPVAPLLAPVAGEAPAADAGFKEWLAKLHMEARGRGISEPTLKAALTDLEPIPRILELDRHQAEFSQTFWRYFDGAVSSQRIAEGQALLKKHQRMLELTAAKYGVPARFLVAFWGLETNYGQNTGGYPVIAALATLAYDGRRSEFFRRELFDALTILDQGHITVDKMKGSWAGAMGQTQFMPSTFMKYAVDADGDGRENIWTDLPDAMSSAAHYLQALGWDDKRGWGREVVLPVGFDVGLASIDSNATETIKPLKEWSTLGIKQANGRPLPDEDIQAALVLPQGAVGPAFLVYDNYRAILKWNRSTFYALSIGHLADRLVGGPPLVAPRMADEPLRREEISVLQDGLQKLGYLKATTDGVIGGETRQALRAFQRANSRAPDGYATRTLIAMVSAQAEIAPTP